MRTIKVINKLFLIFISTFLLTCSGKMDPRYLSPGAPIVLSISPTTGIVSGGQLVTITGTNFRTGLNTVALGGAPCTVQTITPTQITCITGRRASNAVDVVVTASDTLETGTLPQGYGYKAYLYSVSGSTIYSFAINPFTGVLTATPAPSIGIGGTGYGLSIHPSNKFLYAGNASSAAGSNNLFGFTIDQSNGNLTALGGTGAPTSPQNTDAIAFTSDGAYMFAASAVNATNATVTSYIVDQNTGALTTNGATVTATGCRFGGQIIVDSANANLYMSCNSNGSGDANAGLAAYAIAANGTLTFTSFTQGGSGDAISMDLTGTYIYTGNTGPAGAIGCGVHGVFDTRGGLTVYAANGGSPTYIQSCNHNENSGAGATRGSGSSVDQTNRWLVTSARAAGRIQVWDLADPSTPSLTFTVATATGDTNDARFDKTGRFMYDSSLNTVDFFNFDISSGTPTFNSANTATGSPGVSDVTY